MGNLTKKTITRGAVVALALSAGAATTANAAVTRVSGADRYATSTQVLNAWPTTPTTAILAAGVGHEVDALTVAPLAKQKNAPIVLVDTTATTATIVAQFANFSTVYIANGTGVISPAVETALTAAGKTVVRLGGATRYETALNIAKAFGAANNIVVANGDNAHLVDSLSIASIAAAKGMPIFLSTSTGLDSAEATYAKGLGATNAYVLGGPTLVSDAAVTGLGTATRLAGAGRYETNAAVVTAFKADTALDLSNIYVASGEDANLIDSLVAAPLAGLKKAPIVFAHSGLNADVNTLLTGVINKGTNVTVLGGTGAVTADTMGAIMNIQVPGSYVPTNSNTGVLAVSSVTVAGATSFKVVFSQAPADTSKVVFTVLEGTVPVTVTAAWNAAKTEATLTSASNLTEGDYTVNVKNDTTDLGTSTVTIAQQKIAKINITSTKLGVASSTTTASGLGYATYQVLDQYGNDITSSSLANSLTFQTGVGSVDAKNGVLTLTPTMNILQFTSVVITGYDSTSGVSTSATLAVSTQVGTLSDISLSALTNADNKVLTAGDTSSLFYATYTATDMSGNPTTDYKTVLNGLILNSSNQLTTSNSDVTATVVADPSDSNKAAIQIQYISSPALTMDMPIVITAMTYTGKTATLNVTLKKASTVDKVTLMAPAYNIAVGENKEIPFTAVDQNGAVLTKYTDIVGTPSAPLVTVSGAYWYENVDGTASLKAGVATNPLSSTSNGAGFINNGQQVITATTSTGKYSTLTLNIQKVVEADSLVLDTTKFKTVMQNSAGSAIASQNIDFGWDAGGLVAKDQYGRVIDMTTVNGVDGSGNPTKSDQYYVTASSNAPGVVGVTYDNNATTATTGKMHIVLTSGAVGSATVTFSLFSKQATDQNGNNRDITKAVATQAASFSVLANTDIKDYTIDTVANPIYIDAAAGTTGAAITGREMDYTANPTVYGTTATGSKVILAGKPIIGASVDSGDFVITNYNGSNDAPGNVKVAALGLADATKTGSSTNLQVTILGADGNVHSVTTAIKSSTANPVAASIAASVATQISGISVSGDVVTLNSSLFKPVVNADKTTRTATYADILGNSLAKYDQSGKAGTTQNVYIAATDQYGQNSMKLSQFVVVSSSLKANESFTLNSSDGTILTNTATAGDTVTVSGVTSNGLVKTIQIVFN